MSVHKPRTKITEIPVANDKLYLEVARLTKQDKADVKQMVEFVGEFVNQTMKAGNMQGVMIPYFGKFKPKPHLIRAMRKKQLERGTGMDVVYKTIKGKIVTEPKNPKAYPEVGPAGDDTGEENTTL